MEFSSPTERRSTPWNGSSTKPNNGRRKESPMSARNGIVFFVIIAAVAGCATAPADVVARGTIVSQSPGAQAVVRGPITLHAYAGFTGGEIYAERAATGTNPDCFPPRHENAAIPLPADRVISVAVPAGAVACLRTQTDTPYELLWHGVPGINGPAFLAAAMRADR
jgi:hypothetical protein